MRHLGFLILLLLPGIAAAQDARVVVPITQTVLPDHDIRYSIPVSIGGAPPVATLLDTGSTGLRVFGPILANATIADTGATAIYAYGSGERLAGSIGTANVAIGGVPVDAPIPLEIVRQTGCMDFQPACPAANLSFAQYGIGGDGIAGQGFQAIMGVSLEPATGQGYTVNPLTHIGAKRWIITLPEPGAQTSGALILNPSDDDLNGFQMFPLAAEQSAPNADPGWADTLNGCLNNLSQDQTICGAAVLDTGSPGIIAYRPGGISGPLWSADDAASLQFTAPGSTSTASIPFSLDRFPGSGTIQAPDTGEGAALLAGVLPFFAYDVLYDAAAGAIGLRPRADAPDMTLPGQQTSPDIQVIQINAPPRLPTAISGAPKTIAPAALPQVIYPSQ